MTAVPPEVPAQVCYRPLRQLIDDAVAAGLVPPEELLHLVTIPRVLSDASRFAKVGGDGPYGPRTQAWVGARSLQLRALAGWLRAIEAATTDGREQMLLAGLRVRALEIVERLDRLRPPGSVQRPRRP